MVGAREPLPSAVILEAGANDSLDITAAEILKQLIAALRSADIVLALADVRLPVLEMARRTGVLAELGEHRVFRTVDEAIEALEQP